MNDEFSVFGVQCSVKNMTALADAAFRQAARKVVLRAKQTGTPVVLWKDGKVVEVAADEFNKPLFNEQEDEDMSSISIEQAQAELSQLIENLQPGEEVEMTKDNQTVAKLVGQKRQRQFGLGKGKLTIAKEDDEHLEDFKEYMP